MAAGVWGGYPHSGSRERWILLLSCLFPTSSVWTFNLWEGPILIQGDLVFPIKSSLEMLSWIWYSKRHAFYVIVNSIKTSVIITGTEVPPPQHTHTSGAQSSTENHMGRETEPFPLLYGMFPTWLTQLSSSLTRMQFRLIKITSSRHHLILINFKRIPIPNA